MGRVRSGVGILIGALQLGNNVEAARSKDDSEGEPETTVRGQCGGTEGVADSHLPHTGKQLDETTVAVGEGDDDVRLSNVARTHVNQRQHESGERESGQPKGRRIGKVALGSTVKTRLELSSEGGQPQARVVGCNMGERVAAIVIGRALLGRDAGMVDAGGAVGAVGLLGDFLRDCQTDRRGIRGKAQKEALTGLMVVDMFTEVCRGRGGWNALMRRAIRVSRDWGARG